MLCALSALFGHVCIGMHRILYDKMENRTKKENKRKQHQKTRLNFQMTPLQKAMDSKIEQVIKHTFDFSSFQIDC